MIQSKMLALLDAVVGAQEQRESTAIARRRQRDAQQLAREQKRVERHQEKQVGYYS